MRLKLKDEKRNLDELRVIREKLGAWTKCELGASRKYETLMKT